jgi:hypothetical protein
LADQSTCPCGPSPEPPLRTVRPQFDPTWLRPFCFDGAGNATTPANRRSASVPVREHRDNTESSKTVDSCILRLPEEEFHPEQIFTGRVARMRPFLIPVLPALNPCVSACLVLATCSRSSSHHDHRTPPSGTGRKRLPRWILASRGGVASIGRSRTRRLPDSIATHHPCGKPLQASLPRAK